MKELAKKGRPLEVHPQYYTAEVKEDLHPNYGTFQLNFEIYPRSHAEKIAFNLESLVLKECHFAKFELLVKWYPALSFPPTWSSQRL